MTYGPYEQIAVAVESALARDREVEEGLVSRALMSVARAIRDSREEAGLLREITRSATTASSSPAAVRAGAAGTRSSLEPNH